MGINLEIPMKSRESCLMLYLFDDSNLHFKSYEEFMKDIERNPDRAKAFAIKLTTQSTGTYKECQVISYDKKQELYEVMFFEEDVAVSLPTLYVCFAHEDVELYCKRVLNAFLERKKGYNLIEYNFYLDNMPVQGLPTFSDDQIEYLYWLIKSECKFKLANKRSSLPFAKPQNNPLCNEMMDAVNYNHARTLNKMIFDKYMQKPGVKFLHRAIAVPKTDYKKEHPYMGKLDTGMSVSKFKAKLEAISVNTVLKRKDIIDALEDIQSKCEHYLKKYEIFNISSFNLTKTTDEFEKVQKGAIGAVKNQISQIWLKEIMEILTNRLPALFTNEAKEKNKQLYNNSLLKKFFYLIKFHMEDTIDKIAKKSIKRFVSYFRLAKPDNYDSKSACEVTNSYNRYAKLEPGTFTMPEPLFSIEVIADPETNEFNYNRDLVAFSKELVCIFENGVKALQSVDNVERKLMRDYFRSDPIKYLRAPQLAETEPLEPTYEERKNCNIPDSNIWLWAYYKQYQDIVLNSVEKPNDYLKYFQVFTADVVLDPQSYFEGKYGAIEKGLDDWYEIIKVKEKNSKKEAERDFGSDKKDKNSKKKDLNDEAKEGHPEDYISDYQSEKASEELGEEEPQAVQEVQVEPEEIVYELADIMADLKKQRTRVEEIREQIPNSTRLGMYQIDCLKIKKIMMDKHWKIIEKLKFLLWRLVSYEVWKLNDFKDKLIKRLNTKPLTIKDLNELKKTISDVPTECATLNEDVKKVWNIYEEIDAFYILWLPRTDYEVEPEMADRLATLRSESNDLDKLYKQRQDITKFWKKISEEAHKIDSELNNRKNKYLNKLRKKQEKFLTQYEKLTERVKDLVTYNEPANYAKYAEDIEYLTVNMQHATKKAERYNEQEGDHKVKQTDYSSLKEVNKKLQNYSNLWVTTKNWKLNEEKWMSSKMDVLAEDDIEAIVMTYKTNLNKAKKFFKSGAETEFLTKIAEDEVATLVEFDQFVPMAVCLSVKSMQDRHWESLSASFGTEVNSKQDHFNLRYCIDQGFTKYIEQIDDVSTKAIKEEGIEKEMKTMKDGWADVDFELMPMKNAEGVFIIKNFEDCINLTDEHAGVTTNLYFSPFKGPFETEIDEWKEGLETVGEVLEKWVKLMLGYMYLYPIFTSDDIKSALPQETKNFNAVKANWNENTKRAMVDKNVMAYCNNPELRDQITKDIEKLDMVQKNLDKYLTMKKTNFARLYFLSDDELLKILSNTKDPRNVNDYLRKIFECMEYLIFNDQNQVTHMCSEYDEKVILHNPITTKGVAFELWCKKVEDEMVDSMRKYMFEAVQDYADKKRPDWVKEWYGQCVLNGTQIWWTKESEEAINAGLVQEYYDQCNNQILDLVYVIKQPLTKVQKKNVSPLIVQGVHERDIIKNLVSIKIQNIYEYEWMSQLRFYMEEKDLYARCMQTNFPYGYEYMGNADRLVITPLTDKCYMTLMGALRLNLGGAPAGPAGTGKTETTKDLSKNLAKLCKIFNCGPEMEYKMIGTFFKGLTSSGAWVCFDEFNRIILEVLSVIAQYLQQLLDEKKKGEAETTCIFLDTEIKVISTFNVYITMNPTYAGRQALPDNLKALFRPCAMMVPDYRLIAEIFFYSFGFLDSTNLAGKMTDTFKLCSEQLSKQDHYDYGMRAVRSTINAAGLIKREKPDMDESEIVLKAVVDINLPKFLKMDIPLFTNILSDLFPGITTPESNLGVLRESINVTIDALHYYPESSFIEKIYQLFDTMTVRHGLMLVGPTGSGKTATYKILSKAINDVALDVFTSPKEDLATNPYRKVVIRTMNPKGILNEQIYGQLNQMTKEYTKGLVPVLFNKSCDEVKAQSKQWIMFDGPVDSLWIESMNSVLDDSKKLCLPNSEIIDMTGFMTCMFETDDLSEASPATISRCGMVYMDPLALGYKCFFENFKIQFPDSLKDSGFVKKIGEFYNSLIEEVLFRMRRECIQIVVTSENNYIYSLFKLINALVAGAKPNELNVVDEVMVASLTKACEMIFIYSLTWTIGGNVDTEGRVNFDKLLKEIIQDINTKNGFKIPIPSESYYDYTIDIENNNLIMWSSVKEEFEFNSKLSYDEIVVPTVDSTIYLSLSLKLLSNHYHVLKCGSTGTGKSLNSDAILSHALFNPKFYTTISMTFSARSGVKTILDTVSPKLKRRRAGVLGPDQNKKGLVFVDDLNMPKKEKYGAQPVLELLRQWFDHHGWYDMTEFEFKQVIDIFFLAAMGLPGGGRAVISNRTIRHFNILTYIPMKDSSIQDIFVKIAEGFHKGHTEAVQSKIATLVTSTLVGYNRLVKFLLPIPVKSHYLFNLRDISKVFQGLCKSESDLVTEEVSLYKLWVHEMNRVFRDRLTDDKDREDIDNLIKDILDNTIQFSSEKVLDKDRILYGEIMDDKKVYQEIESLSKLKSRLELILEDYNSMNTEMNLIMFSDACEHVVRICRIIGLPKGNALLMGVGGSGRSSCSKLANYAMGFEILQIEITKDYKIDKNWKEDIKRCLMQAGADRKPTTFLLVDTQIIEEKQLIDINNILNTGDVPNLYEAQDKDAQNKLARKDCQDKGIDQTPLNLFTQYLIAVKKNVHIVLAFSPMSDSFRSNLVMFPALVNSTTIDFYAPWPNDALLSVAEIQLTSSDLGLGKSQNGVVNMFAFMHGEVRLMSEKYREELKRYNYVTPTSYLELIRCYQQVLKMKRAQFDQSITRYEKGLKIIDNASKKVASLQSDIEVAKPKLKKLGEELVEKDKVLKENLAVTEVKSKDVSAKAEVQNAEVAVLNEKTDKIKEEKKETEQNKEDALKSADSLSKDDFGLINSFSNPPADVSYLLKLVVLVFDMEKHVKKKDEDKEWFMVCKNMLMKNSGEFKETLKKRVKEEIISKAQYNKLMKEFLPEKVNPQYYAKIASACVKLSSWICAMKLIYETNVKLEPIMRELAEGQAKLDAGQKILDALNKDLKECTDKVTALKAEAKECQDLKEKTENDLALNEARLVRADKLLGGLASEKSRWEGEVKRFKYEKEFLIGNCTISAGAMSYCGPFDSVYRKKIVEIWIAKIVEEGIRVTDDVSLINVVGNKIDIQGWKSLYSLPDDDLSIENGIILQYTKRWPLCIDPQIQANTYIKKQGQDIKKQFFKVLKASDDKISSELEKAVRNGWWVLIEGVTEKLSPELEPILVPQIKQKGKMRLLKFGEKEIDYNDEFRFFMTTTMPNPHYSPETCVKICLINMAITESGLKDQMLSLAVSIEKSELESERVQLVEQSAKDEQTLVRCENDILKALEEANPDTILDFDDIINQLSETKTEAKNIEERQKEAAEKQEQIKIERDKYILLSQKNSILFFGLTEMLNIDHMYQYSLDWYKGQFRSACEEAELAEEDEARIKHIFTTFLRRLYTQVCRTLFDKDKLLFSFNLVMKLKIFEEEVDKDHFKYLLMGFMEEVVIPDSPAFVDSLAWGQMFKTIYGLQYLRGFDGFYEYFSANTEKFEAIYNTEDPKPVPFPGEWNTNLDPFQKLLVYKAIRPDYINEAIKNYIIEVMGKFFVEPPLFDIAEGYKSSTKETPIIFILTPGSDPLNDLKSYTERLTGRGLQYLSLGQGQGKEAEAMYKKFSLDGTWLMYQNTHVYLSWIASLNKIVENLSSQEVNGEFRLFLTTSSTPDFPVSILQQSVKMTVESTGDVKQMMLNAWNQYDDEYLDSAKNPETFKTLLFGCTLFHALLIDRKKFGAIGWSSPTYDFSDTDLGVTKDQLLMMIEDSDEIQYKVMEILAAKINYGGRVTDGKDERFIQTFVGIFINPQMLTGKYFFDVTKNYTVPPIGTQSDYKEYIINNFNKASPELFGLHANADIATNQSKSDRLLFEILGIQPRTSSAKGGKSQEDLNEEKAFAVKAKVPKSFDLELMDRKFPTDYNESMNTVMTQESQRYNTLIHKMDDNLTKFIEANRGRIVMTDELEMVGIKLMNNDVPPSWTEEAGCGFLSIKPLSNWLIDLERRIEFMTKWENYGTPYCFWFSGFFFPAAFLTGTKQNFARKHKIPIDRIVFQYEIVNDKFEMSDITEKAPDGCYVQGCYLEGCRYDYEKGHLVDSNPRELYTKMPIVWLKPVDITVSTEVDRESVYECPVYKTLARYGTLSTTGHSTNFVMMIDIPTVESNKKWTMAGVAAFLSLKFD